MQRQLLEILHRAHDVREVSRGRGIEQVAPVHRGGHVEMVADQEANGIALSAGICIRSMARFRQPQRGIHMPVPSGCLFPHRETAAQTSAVRAVQSPRQGRQMRTPVDPACRAARPAFESQPTCARRPYSDGKSREPPDSRCVPVPETARSEFRFHTPRAAPEAREVAKRLQQSRPDRPWLREILPHGGELRRHFLLGFEGQTHPVAPQELQEAQRQFRLRGKLLGRPQVDPFPRYRKSALETRDRRSRNCANSELARASSLSRAPQRRSGAPRGRCGNNRA